MSFEMFVTKCEWHNCKVPQVSQTLMIITKSGTTHTKAAFPCLELCYKFATSPTLTEIILKNEILAKG